MDIRKVRIGAPISRVALQCEAVTITVGGKKVSARVVISADALHHQMLKATKNKSQRSLDGAIEVIVTQVEEVA